MESESHPLQRATETIRTDKVSECKVKTGKQAACSLDRQKWEAEEEERKTRALLQINLADGTVTDCKLQISFKEHLASL